MSLTLLGGGDDERIRSASALCVFSLPLRLVSYKQWSHTFQRACFCAICHDVTSSQSTRGAAWGSVCVCVSEGMGVGWQGGGSSPLGKAHLLSYYLVLPASMRADMHIKSRIHRLPVIHTASQWCNTLYMCYIGVLYCMLCGNYRSVMVMMYSNIFYIVHSMLQGDCSVLLKWVTLAVPVSPSFGETQLSRYVLIFWFTMNLWGLIIRSTSCG